VDLNTITALHRPRDRAELAGRLAGADSGVAPLAGGTWLFSQPQPRLHALVDLTTLGWPPFTEDADGLEMAATCTLHELAHRPVPQRWPALAIARPCCEALVGSFKVWHTATVGGNVCLALPAGPITSLAVALDGVAVIWTRDGGERRVPVADLVVGVRRTTLRPGEVLRAIRLPAAALAARAVFHRASLAVQGRSGSVVIARRDPDGTFVLTVTAATDRPYRWAFPAPPPAAELAAAIGTVPRWYDDPHGAPDWRHAVTRLLAEQARAELA
jgi:CO/xanthine dehydrogenase FAD-binding subunit